MKLLVEYLHKDMKPLSYAHDYDAGADVSIYEDIVIKHGKNIIPLGFKLIIPPGYAGFLYPRSSVMGSDIRYDSAPIDPDYSGEWNLVVYNSGEDFLIKKDSRICQVVIHPVLHAEFVESLDNRRSNNGLGSTGK